MKVAIVHELLHKYGGAERVAQLFANMFPNAPVYTLVYNEKTTGHAFPKERVVTSNLQKYFKYFTKPQPFLPFMPKAIESFNFAGYDLVLSSSSAFAHGILTPLETKHICYCHAPMRYAWDYTNEYRAEKHTGKFGFLKDFLISKTLHAIRQWDAIAAERPDTYLAASKTIQRRLLKYYKTPSTLLYPPVQTHRFTPQTQKADYFLIVSALTPFKKIDLAIEAFNNLNYPLYIIGDGDHMPYLQKIAKPHIKFLGRKFDADIQKYMESARGLIFPGEDDFGIVPVESMSAATPVLAYHKAGATETVLEGKTGEFFYEQTVDSLIKGLNKLIKNAPHYKTQDFIEQSQKFSEETFTINLLKEIDNIMSK